MFDNVTYTYYSNTLGRAVIPDEDSFNELKLTNVQEMKKKLPYITEREENGIDSAVCLMMEAEYKTSHISEKSTIASESISGHSVSYDNSEKDKMAELNVKSLAETKIQMIKLFCDVNVGVI